MIVDGSIDRYHKFMECYFYARYFQDLWSLKKFGQNNTPNPITNYKKFITPTIVQVQLIVPQTRAHAIIASVATLP